ncbi:MAG: sugar kinase [Mycobacteriales bacterium]
MTAAPHDLVTLGEPLIGLVGTAPLPMVMTDAFGVHVVGAESNLAIGLARLGRRVAYVGKVGADALGARIRRTLAAEGIDVSHLTDADAPTGLLLRDRPIGGAPEVIYRRTQSAGSLLCAQDVAAAADVIAKARGLHITGVTCALSSSCRDAVSAAVRTASAAGVPISFDVNYRSRLWTHEEAAATLRPLLPHCHTIFGSVDELCLVAGSASATDAVRSMLHAGVQVVVLKMGEAGAQAWTADGAHEAARAVDVPVVDVVGAGDAFAAGWLAARLLDYDLSDCLTRANAYAATVVATVGDTDGLAFALPGAGLPGADVQR